MHHYISGLFVNHLTRCFPAGNRAYECHDSCSIRREVVEGEITRAFNRVAEKSSLSVVDTKFARKSGAPFDQGRYKQFLEISSYPSSTIGDISSYGVVVVGKFEGGEILHHRCLENAHGPEVRIFKIMNEMKAVSMFPCFHVSIFSFEFSRRLESFQYLNIIF